MSDIDRPEDPAAHHGPDESGDSGEGEQRAQPSPFTGTPLEQLMAAFTSGQGGTSGLPDLNAVMAQLQRVFASHDGSVNWELAKDIARSAVAQTKDPTPTAADRTAVEDAMRLAELWLDTATGFPAASSQSEAWSRAEWVEATMPVWERLVEPVAGSVVAAMGKAVPSETQAMAAPLMTMLSQAGGAMFGSQVGQAVGGLATEVFTASEIGLPLGPAGRAAILPVNAREFGDGLGLAEPDVLLYLALRECAAQRLFKHVPWLQAHLFGAVEEFGRGITIDLSAIEQAIGDVDPANPEALQEAFNGGLFEPQQTPGQQAALVRLETALALVEGWIDDVVGQATEGRMPAAGPLHEAMRRRRASGGPAEQTFSALVGLELRPRRLRDAATLWGAVRTQGGAEARDAVWAHPDLMPGPAELDDPLGFAQAEPPEQEVIDAEFDAALADLLEQPDDHSGSPESESTTPDERSIPPDPDADGSDERPEGSR
jgi:putative hydrolase